MADQATPVGVRALRENLSDYLQRARQGASFIVMSGLYAFYRERKLASLRPAASASALPPEGV